MSAHVRSLSTITLWLAIPSLALAQAGQEKPQPPEQVRQRLNEPQVAVRFAPDGQRFVVCGQNQSVRIYDNQGKELTTLKNAPGGWSVNWSPDGKKIAVCGLDRTIRLWDVNAAQTARALDGQAHLAGSLGVLVGRHELRQLEGHSQTAWESHFINDGKFLLSIGEDTTIRFWDVSTGHEVAQLYGHPGAVWSMALSRDGRMLATGGSDGSVRLWDMSTGRQRRTCAGKHSGGVWPLVFSPDGRTLASAGWQDGHIYLWEVGTGLRRREIPHPTGAKALAFSPDGRTLYTAGNDHFIRSWNLFTGDQQSPLEGHKGTVNAIGISPDGMTLVSASSDNTMRVWDLSQRVTVAKPGMLPTKVLESHWTALQREDGASAYEAVSALAAAPDQALPLLRTRVQPASAPDVQRITTLIADTGNAKFAVREKATGELEQLGSEAEQHLIKAVSYSPSLETRKRAERLLKKLENSGLKGEPLRSDRVVEVLERMGTAEAKDMLQTLAAGAPEARLTLEAQAALKRFK